MKYLVELPDTPADVSAVVDNWSLARDWCRERFFGRWQYKGMGVFSFNEERDAIIFALKWA